MVTGFIQLPRAIMQRSDIPVMPKLVYCVMRNYARVGLACPAIAQVARELGVDRHTVMRSINRLVSADWVTVTKGKNGAKNVYDICQLPDDLEQVVPLQSAPKPVAECNVEQNATWCKLQPEPGANCDTDQLQSAPKPVANCNANIKKNSKRIIKDVELPYTDPAFVDAWKNWDQHLKELRKKRTPSSIQKQLKKLEEMGLERAIAALEFSLCQGYQGIFEPKGSTNKRNAVGPPRSKTGRYDHLLTGGK